MKILLQYLKPYKWLIALALLLAAINQVFSLMDPYIFGKIIDRFAKQSQNYNQPEFVNGVLLLIGAAVGVAMISRIAKAFQDYFTNVIIQKFGANVYTDGIRHALQLPFQQFEDQRSGETLAVLQKVRTDTEKFMAAFINILFVTLVGIVVVMGYAWSVYPPLVPLYIAASVGLGFLMKALSKRIKFIQKNIVKETTALAGATTESLRNIELVKSLGLTNQEVQRLNKTTLSILHLELRKVRSIRSLSFIQGTFVNLLRQGILFMLLMMIYKNHASLGQVMTLQFYSFFLFGPLQELGNIILAWREAETSLENFQKLMEKPVEPRPLSPRALHNIRTLQFSDVSFKHLTAAGNALEDINFTVKEGESVAFVGPSGSGKTTLVKLLVGLYQPVNGQVCYNGIPGSEINIDELRQQIGFVTQDTQLFSGTIRENLLFVNPSATDEQMMDVLRKASAQTLLSRAENGLDTVIGEGGMKISGGEKQRLSIARALLRNPRLLVFDEATSALDSITEDDITQTIRSITASGNQITVMIAHRLSTIMHADRIIVLEKGRIAETGSHESLLEEKGLYYAMWRQQIGERKNTVAVPVAN
jgi:ATP-binding cassette subfamily B protein